MPPSNPSQRHPFPAAKRYEYFPVREGVEVTSVPAKLKKAVLTGKATPVDLERLSIEEFWPVTTDEGKMAVEVNKQFQQRTLERKFREVVRQRRVLGERIKTLECAVELESSASTVKGLGNIFGGLSQANQLESLRKEHAAITQTFVELRTRVAEEVRARQKGSTERSEQGQEAAETLFGLMRRADARRKYVVYEQLVSEISQTNKKELLLRDVSALLIRAQDLQFSGDPKRPPESVGQILRTHLSDDFDDLVESYLQSGVLQFDVADEKQAHEIVSNFLMEICSKRSQESLSTEVQLLRNQQRELRDDLEARLRDPRNSELAEYIQEKEVEALLEGYHVREKTFIPVGELKADMETLRERVLAPGGKLARVLLYGPPGTGKTESFREIARQNNQPCRVISIHEGSSFETLIGMHQLPLPKAETMKDATIYWNKIEGMSMDELSTAVPEDVLKEFSGETLEEQASDYKRWYKNKLDLARTISALGAVAPDDPRVVKARQEALAAWVDQPLSIALEEGAIIVLDEVDKAGKGLEGVYDLLTRRPGKTFHPAGRSKPYRIHPNARIVATSNWGDIQSERAGGGDIPPAIISRFPEKRKVGYLNYETEMQLLEVMSTPPDDPKHSLLTVEEYVMASQLISHVFDKLRKMYLSPGDISFVSPISVRTLENIIESIVDPATRTRRVDRHGVPTHFLEAAWSVLMMGPWRGDDAKVIRKEIFKEFATSGMFNSLDTWGYPKHILASRLTGISPDEAAQILGVRNPARSEVPKGFRFGKNVLAQTRAINTMLFSELHFESSRMILEEEDKAWRKRIEEEGGDPDVQNRLSALTDTWLSMRSALPDTVKKNPEELLAADVDILKNFVLDVVVEPEDIQVYVNRITTEILPGKSPEEQRVLGLFISRVLYLRFEKMTDEEARTQEVTIDLSASPPLDYLGYRHSRGMLTIIGKAGNYVGREMSGGHLTVDFVQDQFCNRMKGGQATAEKVGSRSFQNMEGGNGFVSDVAGDRAAFGIKGGELHLKTVGERACTRAMGGTVYIGTAGNRLGENSEKDVTIFVENMELKGSQCKAKIVVGPLPAERKL